MKVLEVMTKNIQSDLAALGYLSAGEDIVKRCIINSLNQMIEISHKIDCIGHENLDMLKDKDGYIRASDVHSIDLIVEKPIEKGEAVYTEQHTGFNVDYRHVTMAIVKCAKLLKNTQEIKE
jgi:hypothetical protein